MYGLKPTKSVPASPITTDPRKKVIAAVSNVEVCSTVIASVRQALETFASKGSTVTFSDIERIVGTEFRRDQWQQILDPIYEELRSSGEPDLTAIVVYKGGEKDGYPAYFSDGGKARSRPFNPNNKKQLARWVGELKRVFAKYQGV
jgi:hypothetical protein